MIPSVFTLASKFKASTRQIEAHAGIGRMNMEQEKKVRRGGQFYLSNFELTEILNKAMGLEPETFVVRGVNNADYIDGVSVNVTSHDERFPVIVEGEYLPRLFNNTYQEVEQVGNSVVVKTIYKGFVGIESTESPSETEAEKDGR